MTVKQIKERLEGLDESLEVGTMFWGNDSEELEVFFVKDIRQVEVIRYDEVEEAEYKEEDVVILIVKDPEEDEDK